MDVFTALADPTRRQIVERLAADGELSATEIADAFPISAQAVSQHLKVLRETRLVRMEKHAQQRIYQVDLDSVRMIETWARNIEQLWHERFVSLTALIAEEKAKVGAKGKNK